MLHTLNAHDAGLWLGRLLIAVIQGLSAYVAPQQRNGIVTAVLGEFAHGDATVHSVAELALFIGDERPELQLAAKRYVEAIENAMSAPVQVLYFAIPRDPGPLSSGAFEEQLGDLPLSTYLALVGARVISGSSGLAQRVTEMIRSAPLTVQTESIREVQIETRREQPEFWTHIGTARWPRRPNGIVSPRSNSAAKAWHGVPGIIRRIAARCIPQALRDGTIECDERVRAGTRG